MSADAGAVTANEAVVRVVNGPLVAPVLGRVVGMLAARAQCPVDRLDDALLVADAIAAHSQAHSRDGHVTVGVHAGPEGLEMRIFDLARGGADGLLTDAALPGVGNVLERIADDVVVERGDEKESVRIRLGFGR